MAPLDADEQKRFSLLCECGSDIVSRGGQSERIRIGTHETMDDVDLLQSIFDRGPGLGRRGPARTLTQELYAPTPPSASAPECPCAAPGCESLAMSSRRKNGSLFSRNFHAKSLCPSMTRASRCIRSAAVGQLHRGAGRAARGRADRLAPGLRWVSFGNDRKNSTYKGTLTRPSLASPAFHGVTECCARKPGALLCFRPDSSRGAKISWSCASGGLPRCTTVVPS